MLWAGYFEKSFDLNDGWTTHITMPDDPASQKNNSGPVIASVKGAISREGIDDRKYLETLRFYATKKKSQTDLDWLEKDLPRQCNALASGLDEAGGLDNIEVKVINANAMHKIREEIKNRILKLVK